MPPIILLQASYLPMYGSSLPSANGLPFAIHAAISVRNAHTSSALLALVHEGSSCLNVRLSHGVGDLASRRLLTILLRISFEYFGLLPVITHEHLTGTTAILFACRVRS